MKYLHLLDIPPMLVPRDKKVKLSKSQEDKLLRDNVAQMIFNFVVSEPNDKPSMQIPGPFKPKKFDDFADHRNTEKVREKLLFDTDKDWVSLGNDFFEFIKKKATFKGYDSTQAYWIVAISDLLDKVEKQNPEEAEKEFLAHKDDQPLTWREYYEKLGAIIEVIPDLKNEI